MRLIRMLLLAALACSPVFAHADDEACPVTDLYTCREALLRWLG